LVSMMVLLETIQEIGAQTNFDICMNSSFKPRYTVWNVALFL